MLYKAYDKAGVKVKTFVVILKYMVRGCRGVAF